MALDYTSEQERCNDDPPSCVRTLIELGDLRGRRSSFKTSLSGVRVHVGPPTPTVSHCAISL